VGRFDSVHAAILGIVRFVANKIVYWCQVIVCFAILSGLHVIPSIKIFVVTRFLNYREDRHHSYLPSSLRISINQYFLIAPQPLLNLQ